MSTAKSKDKSLKEMSFDVRKAAFEDGLKKLIEETGIGLAAKTQPIITVVDLVQNEEAPAKTE